MGEKIRPSEEINSIEKEKNPERFPTAEEVKALIKEYVGSKNVIEKRGRIREYGDGLRLLEVVVEWDRPEGGTIEYTYQRKEAKNPDSPEGSATITGIYVTFYDKDDYPYNGYTLADYMKGEWVSTGLSPDVPFALLSAKENGKK